MFKRIDEEEQDIEGYSYEGQGGVETVTLPQGSSGRKYVSINDSEGDEVCIYVADIPNLIRALQASYNYNREG